MSSQPFSEPRAAHPRGSRSPTSPVTPRLPPMMVTSAGKRMSRLGPLVGSGLSCVASGASFYFHASHFPIFKVTSLNAVPWTRPDPLCGGDTLRTASERASQGLGRWRRAGGDGLCVENHPHSPLQQREVRLASEPRIPPHGSRATTALRRSLAATGLAVTFRGAGCAAWTELPD